MVLIHVYKQQNTEKALCKGHFVRYGKIVRSTDVLPFTKEMIAYITKGYNSYAVINVINKSDLDIRVIDKADLNSPI